MTRDDEEAQENGMLGIVYILLCMLVGRELAARFLFRINHEKNVTSGTENTYAVSGQNFCWIFWPAAFAAGTLAVTWAVYGISWAADVIFQKTEPLFYGNIVVMAAGYAGVGGVFLMRFCRNRNIREKFLTESGEYEREAVFFAILAVFLLWIMFYVFHIKDGVLYSGFSVFGDYAPHTAMMRSFSRGDNFPTQYPHYGGSDVKYHFMFQFLAGNLEYLGMRLDLAYNLISVLALLGFLMMLYGLAVRITGMAAAGAGAVVLFFFRSGTAFFRFAAEHVQAGDLWQVLKENTSFIGYTANEDWGLWNFNVYLNQRHLAFGLIIVCTALWIYLDWVEAGNRHTETGLCWMKKRLFSREAWMFRDAGRALAVGILLGLSSFWNGAAVIGGLLILMGFGLFSDGKLDYALTALAAVICSLIQTKIFIKEGGMTFSFYWGLLAEDKSLPGVLWYLIQMSGIFFVGLLILALFLDRMKRSVLTAFLFPVLFAFCISLTPDINVNHKYVMIAYAFLTIFWAYVLLRLWKKGITGKAAAVVLAVCLTITGIYDFVVILKDNDRGHRVGVVMDSDLTEWLEENLDSSDLILTPEYSMNEVTMAGVMMYCGWPYYAWSAGYDTYYRASVAVLIYTTPYAEEVKSLTEQEGIDYILFQEGMTFEEKTCREDAIADAYPLVYTSNDGRIRIYQASEK